MEQQVIERMETKTAEEAIINQISRDFNLAPFMARTYFQQMQHYFERYLHLERDIGQMSFLAVSADSPPGQALAASQRVAISLTLDCADDLVALGQGTASLRRRKIERLSQEAREQGALLSQEDLARLLCSSRSTIKRDIAWLRASGRDVPTRGQVKDIGRGLSHKSQIVGDWLAGYTFSQIHKRRWHALSSIERYCRDFQRVFQLHQHGLSVAEIRQSTGLSERLIGEHLALANAAGADNDRLQQLRTSPAEATEQPAQIKRGAWLK